MKKSLLVLLITLTLIATLFAGCGGSTKTADTDSTDTNADSTNSPTAFPSPSPTASPSPSPTASPSPTPKSSTQTDVDIGDTVTFGEYEWLVLDKQDGKILIITENIVEFRAYHTIYLDEEKMPGLVESSPWETCTLRSYLNNDFYNTFSAEDMARIATTANANGKKSFLPYVIENETVDKIFLLSLDEVVKYFGWSGQTTGDADSNLRIDDEYNNNRIAYTNKNEAASWWLRTTGSWSNYHAVAVETTGSVNVAGVVKDTNWEAAGFGGVRPALWLNLES